MRLQPVLFASALLLGASGVVALFAPDEIAAWLGLPPAGAARALVQLLSGALFALGMLDWMNRYATVGGIYGRPVVITNFTFFLIAATTLARAAAAVGGGVALWVGTGVCAVLAVLYGRLFFGAPPQRPAKDPSS